MYHITLLPEQISDILDAQGFMTSSLPVLGFIIRSLSDHKPGALIGVSGRYEASSNLHTSSFFDPSFKMTPRLHRVNGQTPF